jgi:thiamine biosynthesis lipoprotein
LVHLWGFDGDDPHVPADDAVAGALSSVGLDKIEIVDDEHVRKLNPAVEIDMSSLGQGYTVGRLAAVVEGFGIDDYLVEIGGELAGRGRRPDGASWRVGVEDPDSPGGVLRALALPADRLTAVITSGTYRHYFEEGGRVYGHILDPRTGRPVQHALVSVTVTGPVAEIAAGWGTALLCLGPEEGAAAAEREHVSAAFVIRTEGKLELRASRAFAEAWPQGAERAQTP